MIHSFDPLSLSLPSILSSNAVDVNQVRKECERRESAKSMERDRREKGERASEEGDLMTASVF